MGIVVRSQYGPSIAALYCRTMKQEQDRDLIVYSSHFILMFQVMKYLFYRIG